MSYRLKYTQTFEKQMEKIKKKNKRLLEEAMKKVEKLRVPCFSSCGITCEDLYDEKPFL